MSRIAVRRFESRDVDDAARLLAARHRRDRLRLPVLDATLAEQDAWVTALSVLASARHVDGATAVQDGRPVGFAFGSRMIFSPADVTALFVPPHSIFMPVDGHAVDAEADATEVYRALYAFLAEAWTRSGFFIHRWLIPAGDPGVQEALVSLGFGRVMTAGVRDTAATVSGVSEGVTVRRATSSDLDIVMGFSDLLAEHHATAPMFWPRLHTADEAMREMLAATLGEGEPPVFVAFADGNPIGLQSLMRPGYTPPTIARDRDIYLFEGMVDPAAQSRGAGTGLLRESMEWAASNGYATCTLHWASQNYSGGPFWLKHGFVPVEQTMERRIDERIAWARP